MNILITGGSGFLGRHLIESANFAGHKVFAPRSSEMNLETCNGINEYFDLLKSDNVQLDAIIHSAAYYGGIGINQTEPATIFYKNSVMAINVFEIARKFNIKKIMPIGSACSYPGHIIGDLSENDFWNGPLHDSVEAYGFSKKMQQVAQRAYFKQHSIESNHLILTNLYGRYDVFTEYRSHVVSAMIKKFADAKIENKSEVILWGDGSPIREFLYVGDAAQIIIKALELPHDTTPINIGTGIGTTIKELAELIAELSEFNGNLVWDISKPNGAIRKVLDINKMKEKIGFTPRTNIREGLAATIKWYIVNKEEADNRE